MSTRRRTAEVVWPTICLVIGLVGCSTENSAPPMAALPQSDLPPALWYGSFRFAAHGRLTWARIASDSSTRSHKLRDRTPCCSCSMEWYRP